MIIPLAVVLVLLGLYGGYESTVGWNNWSKFRLHATEWDGFRTGVNGKYINPVLMPCKHEISDFVVFGDSISDANSCFGKRANITTGWRQRFSNGPIWPDYLSFIVDRPVDSQACGGSSFDNLYTVLDSPSATSQIANYIFTHNDIKETASERVYIIFSGANDIDRDSHFDPHLPVSHPVNVLFRQYVVDWFLRTIDVLHTAGAQRMIVFGLWPNYLSVHAYESKEIDSIFRSVNAALKQAVKKYPQIMFYDTLSFMTELDRHPHNYGIRSVWWFLVHPTTLVHHSLAVDLYQQICNFLQPEFFWVYDI